jgi:hypothetical protein
MVLALRDPAWAAKQLASLQTPLGQSGRARRRYGGRHPRHRGMGGRRRPLGRARPPHRRGAGARARADPRRDARAAVGRRSRSPRGPRSRRSPSVATRPPRCAARSATARAGFPACPPADRGRRALRRSRRVRAGAKRVADVVSALRRWPRRRTRKRVEFTPSDDDLRFPLNRACLRSPWPADSTPERGWNRSLEPVNRQATCLGALQAREAIRGGCGD